MTEVFEIDYVADPILSLAVEVLPYLKTVSAESEISAEAVPFRLAFALEFDDKFSELIIWEHT